jgi:hypothetical protein
LWNGFCKQIRLSQSIAGSKTSKVQESTSKEYGEDIGGAVSRNWESDSQEKRQE